jgi:predicted MPP superfamily phosphohydrolase
MTQALVIYNLLITTLTILLLLLIQKTAQNKKIERSIFLIMAHFCITFLAGILYPNIDGFGRLGLLAWGVFVHFPLFLLLIGFLLRKETRIFSLVLFNITFLILLITVDAFLIEPQWLEISHRTIYSTKLDEPIIIAVLADIQTDQVSSYEEEALSLVAKENPDLILLVGDYLQIYDVQDYLEELARFQKMFAEARLEPPLGIFAVRGNVDWENWPDLFEGSNVRVFQETETLDIGPVSLTGINWIDSGNKDLSIPGTDSYQIVFGHSPNFSLGNIKGDLLIAGHTHGGQFRLPGIGPLLTLSAVPRSWASGLTEIQPGQYLLVSRGIGLERGNSPRMRFLCRPELVFIHLEPH